MTETLVIRYAYDSTQQELSSENQHDRVKKVYRNVCVLVPLMTVASALKGLTFHFDLTTISGSHYTLCEIVSKLSERYNALASCMFYIAIPNAFF